MAWFKKDKIIDLSAKYKKDQEKVSHIRQEQAIEQPYTKTSSDGFGFFSAIANTTTTKNEESKPEIDFSETEERKRKLAKRLSDMTDKLEDLSNQIYHLQQRIEVVERKNDVNRFE